MIIIPASDHLIIQKITDAPSDTYIIFYSPGCYYSDLALGLLRKSKVKYKGYVIEKIPNVENLQQMLTVFERNSPLVGFDPGHKTKPIIFFNGQFLGGYTELREKIDKKI